jgi:tetratricopeptide (TPR) repeat protein
MPSMPFVATASYDRGRILADAARAQSRGRRRKAIELLRQVLRAEPQNALVRKRLALLLVRAKRSGEAHEHYRLAAAEFARRGFEGHAIGVYREALRFLPRAGDLWSELARLEAGRGRAPDALTALRAGARQLRSRRSRPEAIALLEQAHALDPGDVPTALALARLAAREGCRDRAYGVLETVARRSRGPALRRIRFRQFMLRPSPASAWRWLRSAPAASRQPFPARRSARRVRAAST